MNLIHKAHENEYLRHKHRHYVDGWRSAKKGNPPFQAVLEEREQTKLFLDGYSDYMANSEACNSEVYN